MPYKDIERRRELNRAHYRANTSSYAARTRDRRSTFRKIIDETKTNHPCADCNTIYPPYVMDFDHRPGTVKVAAIAHSMMFGSVALLLAEIAKCDIVCSNCHRERTHSRQLRNPLASPPTG